MYKKFFYGDYAIVFSPEMKITLLPKRLSYLGYVLNGGIMHIVLFMTEFGDG